MLRSHGLVRNVTIPVSAGLLTNTADYFAALTAYRRGELEPIVSTMANASLVAVINGSQLVEELRQLRASWGEQLRARQGSAARRLLDVVLAQPVIDGSTAAAALGVRPANIRRAIDPLVEAGILTEFTGFARNRIWEATEVLAQLDAFAERSTRRRLP